MRSGVAAGLVLASVLAGGARSAAAETGPTCPATNPPNTLALVAGTPQTARLRTAFAENLVVVLANTNGCPVTTAVAGTPITFTAPSSGPSGTFSASGSPTAVVGANSSGSAAAPLFTANDQAGDYTVTARSSYGSVSFALGNTAAGTPAVITATSPVSESAATGTRYGQPLQARALDANGNPVQGVPVTFTLGTGAGGSSGPGATFDGGGAQATAVTDSSGVATSPPFTANSIAGPFTAGAAVSGVTQTAGFALENVAAKRPAIAALGQTRRSATVGGHYRRPLQVRVRDGNGKPLRGVDVTFKLGAGAAAGSGAGATFGDGTTEATAVTDAAGVATSPRLAANSTAGTVSATASTAAVAAPAIFSLRNLAGPPAAVTVGVASSESTATGTRFPVRLAVTVTDSHSNPVAGAVVTFAAPAYGPSGAFVAHKTRLRTVRVRTNADGIAVAPAFVANRRPGGYIVTATVKSARRSTAFALVNEPRDQSP